MTDDLRIGLIGAGMVGQIAHLANFVRTPGCRVTALAELRPELGALAARKFGIPQVFADHREMIAAGVVDAVVVVTRRPATGPVVIDALRAGLHVLSEKPMAHTVDQARCLTGTARERDLVYAVGYMKRHDAGTVAAKRLLDDLVRSGELGRILNLRVWSYGGEFSGSPSDYVMTREPRPEGIELWPVAPDWIPAPQREAYAWFLNVFSHDINLLRHFAGVTPKVQTVDLEGSRRVVRFDCGDYPATLEMGEQTRGWDEGVEVAFERGCLSLAFASPLQRQPASLTLVRGSEIQALPIEPSWAFERQAASFVADVAGRQEPLASGSDSLADIGVAEDIWRVHLGHRANR